MPGSIEALYLDKLIKERLDRANAVLQFPKDKSEFGYGQASGIHIGLLLAEQLLNNVLEEVKNDE